MHSRSHVNTPAQIRGLAFLAGVKVTTPQSSSEAKSGERKRARANNGVANKAKCTEERSEAQQQLGEDSLRVLVKVALEPATLLVQVYDDLEFTPANGKRAIDELLALGYVRVHRLCRQGRGGQPSVLEVLSEGIKELARRGIGVTQKLIPRGGFRHDVYGRFVARWARERRYRVTAERTLGEKAFDLVLEHAELGLTGVEIVLSGSVAWNSAQLVKAASVTGLRQLLVACDEQKLLTTLERKFRKEDTLGLFGEKVRFAHLGEFTVSVDDSPDGWKEGAQGERD